MSIIPPPRDEEPERHLWFVKIHWDKLPYDYRCDSQAVVATSATLAIEQAIGDRTAGIVSMSVKQMAPESYGAVRRMRDGDDTTERTRQQISNPGTA